MKSSWRQKRREHEYPREVSHRHNVIAMERDYWQRILRQEQIGRMLALASPHGSLNQIFISLADTGPESQRHFIESAYDYGTWYFDELVANPNNPPTEERAEKMEAFEYRPLPFSRRFEAALPPFISLMLANILLLAIAIFVFNRYDVR